MRNKSTGGFTLIELLIVIAIIGILAAVLIPNLLDARTRALETAAKACLKEISTVEEVYFIDNTAYQNATSVADDIAACNDVNVEVLENSEYGYTGVHESGGNTFQVTPQAGVQPN